MCISYAIVNEGGNVYRKWSSNNILLNLKFVSKMIVLSESIAARNTAFLGVLLCACIQLLLQSSVKEALLMEGPAPANGRGNEQDMLGSHC